MSSPAQRRLLKDLQKIKKQQDEGINASPQENNLLKWQAFIEGSEGTPWEGGLFELEIQFTEEYPNKAPVVVFKSQMFHPNIYKDGRICLDILQNQWSPVYDVWAILTSLRSLLSDPNPLSPANSVAAQIIKEELEKLFKKVQIELMKNVKENQKT